jgi:hypothetical protein
MMELTRRRLDASFEGWAIFYGDVRVGSISARSGVPKHVNQWQWTCGFYPGCECTKSRRAPVLITRRLENPQPKHGLNCSR